MQRGGRSLLIGSLLVLLVSLMMSTSTAWAAQQDSVKVGAVVCLTGVRAMAGAEQNWAYEQAVADINKKGGVFVKEAGKKLPLQLVIADDKSLNDQAAAAMETLAKVHKVKLALSDNGLELNHAAATVAEKYKIYFAMTSTWRDVVEGWNSKWVTNFFFTGAEAAKVPFLIWEGLPKGERPQRVALLMEDNVDGQAFAGAFRQAAKEYGYAFAVDDSYTPGASDYSAQILRMKSANADALLVLAGPSDAIVIIRQMKEAGLKMKYIQGYMGFWPSEFAKALGKDANGTIHDGLWAENSGAPGAKELGRRFKAHFKRDSVSVGLFYANVQVLAAAIEKAGSTDPAKVRDAVVGGEFKGTVMGDLKFNDKGAAPSPCFALQWWNGERMPVYPPVPKVWTLKMMPNE
jgi:branched-chain amino acid transport system substrate-binding protein